MTAPVTLPADDSEDQATSNTKLPSASVPKELLPDDAKALVFDCDGTLLDTMSHHYFAWQYACDQHNLTFTPQMIVELAGKPVHELFDIICQRSGRQAEREEVFYARDEYYKSNDQPACPIQSVVNIVYAGKARGLPMAVASGGTRAHVIKGLTEAGLLEYFDAIVCGEDVTHGKPAPDCFLLAAQQLGVDPQHCVGYEDAKLGIEAINKAGYLAAVDVTKLDGYPHLI